MARIATPVPPPADPAQTVRPAWPTGRHPLGLYSRAPAAVPRWRPLLNWLLVAPLVPWAAILLVGAVAVSAAGWFSILATGRLPESWGDYLMAVVRYLWRVTAYLLGWADEYPGLVTKAGLVDPGDNPAVVYCARAGRRSRWSTLARPALAAPHLAALCLAALPAAVAVGAAWPVALVAGRVPSRTQVLGVGFFRWVARVLAYCLLVTDAYPPFGIRP